MAILTNKLFMEKTHHARYKSLSIVLVVSEDGNIYTFKFDPVNGGDCKLMEVFRWGLQL